MDRASEGDKTRRFVEKLGMTPIMPPKANRKAEWDYDRELCKLRNEVERLFRRLKGCRRICTRFDKLDVMFPGVLNFVCGRPLRHGIFPCPISSVGSSAFVCPAC